MMTAGGFGIVFLFSGLAVHSLAEAEFGERKSFATSNVQHHVGGNFKDATGIRLVPSGLKEPADTCSNGVTGVEASGVCCVLECGTCAGPGCGSRGEDFGLGVSDCCAGSITDSGVFCSLSGAAPCIIDDEPPTPAPITTSSLPSGAISDDMQTLLDLHNEARCEHNADPLVYSDTVEATAQAYAEELTSNCGTFEHSDAEDRNNYGENLYMCWGISGCFSPEGAMTALYDEEVQTDDVLTYGGHATQILWQSTTELGCAVESCTLNGVPYEVLVCHYNPAGNVFGQYLDEVELPSGDSC